MKQYTDKEQDDILNRCDADLIIEIVEENMLGTNIPFNDFLRLYQAKHKQQAILLKTGEAITVIAQDKDTKSGFCKLSVDLYLWFSINDFKFID